MNLLREMLCKSLVPVFAHTAAFVLVEAFAFQLSLLKTCWKGECSQERPETALLGYPVFMLSMPGGCCES